MTVKRDVFPVPLKIRYKGLFDWTGVYRYVNQWLVQHQYRFYEKRYKDKLDTALGNELEVDVYGEREVSEYYAYYVEVNYHLWESREVPVVINGQQTKLWQGRVHIQISGKVITDWQKRYKGDNKTHKFMETFLNKVILKNEIEMKHIDPLDKDLHRLEADLKKLLKIEADASGVE